MKAAVLREAGAPLVIEELEVAPPGPNEVRVKLVASGICHSDFSVAKGKLTSPLPVVLGHEGAGVVEEVGPGVTALAPGDHVVAALTPSCGKCIMCQEGRPYLCAEMMKASASSTLLDGTMRLRNGDEDVHQLMALGTFAEQMVIPAGSAVKVSHNAPLDTVCLVGCGVTTGVGAAVNTAAVEADSSVAVIGCGGVGLSIIQGARLQGAEIIIAVDPIEEKRALAMSMGATHAINPMTEDLLDAVRSITGKGVHYAFEALGRQDTIGQCWQIIRPSGQAVIVGMTSLRDKLDVPVAGFFAEREFRGSVYGSATPHTDIPKYVELYQSGELMLDEMITKRIRLEDVNTAFEEMGRGEGARSVIMYE
jgi:S-(hydroxymethyl)glutathione dehydrogenase / alcohol dehydrogenase